MGAFRRSLAANLSPLLLRVALGVTFVWAGYPKVFLKDAYPPESAAMLANLGVRAAQDAATGAGGSNATPNGSQGDRPAGALPEPTSEAGAARVVLAQSAAPARTYTAADFDAPVELAKLYQVAIMLEGSSTADKPLWPRALAGRPWSVRWAHAVAWTELLAGAFVLLGVLTPLSGLSLACVMGVAMWLTQIGPATLGGGPSFLGFLPPLDFGTNPFGWHTLVFQFALFAMGLSLLFTGGGAISVDRFIFGRPGGSSRGDRASYNSDDDGEGEDDDEEE